MVAPGQSGRGSTILKDNENGPNPRGLGPDALRARLGWVA